MLKKFEKKDKTLASKELLLTAAIALVGVDFAHAESAPEYGLISYKYLDYSDGQSYVPDSYSGASSSTSKNRIKVKAQSLMVMMPIAGEWSLTANYTGDAISGASPEYHSKQLIKLKDHRDAVSLAVTRYLPRGTVTVGVSQSDENDYFSRGFSLLGSVATEDKNTTFNMGVSVSNDEINPTNGKVKDESKRVADFIVGITQVLSVNDVGQLNLGYSSGKGYFSDPYKFNDNRPETKDHFTILGRWKHFFNQTGGSSQLSYRYYQDTYDVKAHTLNLEYAQPFSDGWTFTPSMRLYSQTASEFYIGIDPSNPAYYDLPEMKYSSLDQRLSEYGAVTVGAKISKQLNADWLVDLKYEQYKQKESWALTGNSDGILVPFSFTSIQFGISRRF